MTSLILFLLVNLYIYCLYDLSLSYFRGLENDFIKCYYIICNEA